MKVIKKLKTCSQSSSEIWLIALFKIGSEKVWKTTILNWEVSLNWVKYLELDIWTSSNQQWKIEISEKKKH